MNKGGWNLQKGGKNGQTGLFIFGEEVEKN